MNTETYDCDSYLISPTFSIYFVPDSACVSDTHPKNCPKTS